MYILGDPDDCQWIKLINVGFRSFWNYTQKNNKSADNQIIWLNSHLKVDNTILYHVECIEN